METENNILTKREIKDYNKVKENYRKNKFNIVELDISCIESEQKLMDEISAQLKFPHNSTNLNSVDDWITDLEWMPTKNTVILIKHSHLLKDKELEILLEVIRHAQEFWRKHDVSFDVIAFNEETQESENG